MKINTYDIDGVIYMGEDYVGLWPGPNDHIITGRSFEEHEETVEFLQSRSIFNTLHMNPLKFYEKTRVSSGQHKGYTIKKLQESGYQIGIHFEDDEIQAEEIRKIVPDVQIVMIVHDLVEKENKRHARRDR